MRASEWNQAVRGLTIDGPTSRDLDDAIWVREVDGCVEITVSIAAASAFVELGSPDDLRARDMVETSYRRRSTVPMLPRKVSEFAASLLLGRPRRVVYTRLRMRPDLSIESVDIGRGTLHSKAQLAYGDIPRILDGSSDASPKLARQVRSLAAVAMRLLDRRRDSGALAIYDLTSGWVTTEDGSLRQLPDVRETIGQIIVQEFMIAANAAVAEHCATHGIPIPFRNHVARACVPDRAEVMRSIELATNGPVTGIEILRRKMHLTLNRASYGGALAGHYGLNLPAYAHSTSPIRRYADLVTQRQLCAWIDDPDSPAYPYTADEVDEICEHINTTLRDREAARSETERERATARASSAIARGVDLSALPDVEFERVIKTLIRAGETVPDIADAFDRRARRDALAPLHVYLGLVGSADIDEWSDVRRFLIGHLASNCHLAPSVLGIARSLDKWGDPSYEHRSRAMGGKTVHEAKVVVPRAGRSILFSGWRQGQTLREAKRRCLVEVLATAVGEEMPADDTIVADDADPDADRPLPEHPVSALAEHAVRFGHDPPVYRVTRARGDDHAPVFVAVCEYAGHEVSGGESRTKKDAKRSAAAHMLPVALGEGNQTEDQG